MTWKSIYEEAERFEEEAFGKWFGGFGKQEEVFWVKRLRFEACGNEVDEMDRPGCGIIQDLLLSYSDGLTAENITEMIEEHLENCALCRGKLEELRRNRELAENAETSRGKSFGEKLRGMKSYVIGIMIGLVAPIALLVVIYLIGSLTMLLEGLVYSYL